MARHPNRPKRPRRLSPLGALQALDPDSWERRVRRAMRASAGRVPEAAEALGISKRQLYRILADPRFADVARASVGQPPKSDR